MRRRRAGRALPAADARRAALARHHAHRPLRVDVEHEARRDDRLRHRDRRARADPGRADPRRRQGRDGGQEGRRLFRAEGADRGRAEGDGRARRSRNSDCGDAEAARSLAVGAGRARARARDARRRRCDGELDALHASISSASRTRRAGRRRADPRRTIPTSTCRSTRAGAISCSAAAICGPSAPRRRRGASPAAKARAEFDLAITSVLLDAGAGPSWRYRDAATEHGRRPLGRARASRACACSRPAPSRPIRAIRCAPTPTRLTRLKAEDVAHGFQSMVGNPLVGARRPRRAAREPRRGRRGEAGRVRARGPRAAGRPLRSSGGAGARTARLPAPRILEALLEASRPDLAGPADARRRAARRQLAASGDRRDDATDGLVPFHKLSQWLAYSLIEPLQWAGHRR